MQQQLIRASNFTSKPIVGTGLESNRDGFWYDFKCSKPPGIVSNC
jgi:hypothetical protein